MGLFKTSFLNGIAVLIKMATMFVLNKILAIYVGPSGYALIGQFQNFIQVITTFSGTAINNGIVKYSAEFHDTPEKQITLWRSTTKSIFLISIILSFFIILLKKHLSIWLFHNSDFQYVFVWFAIFLIFFNLNSLLLAVLNGTQQIHRLVFTNILGSLVSFVVSAVLAIQYNLAGALIAISIYQSINCLITFYFCKNLAWFPKSFKYKRQDLTTLKSLFPFALMTFTTVIFGNIAQFVLRDLIINQYDLTYAGYWDAMNRLSSAYLMLATTIISVYFLPRFSKLKTYIEIKTEIFSGYKSILPITVVATIIIYVFRTDIVILLFSEDFLPMLELMKWQLIADILKIGSWLVAYMMISKAMTKIFIAIETFFLLSIIPITYIFIQLWGFQGISIALATNVALYWITCSFFSFKKLQKNYI